MSHSPAKRQLIRLLHLNAGKSYDIIMGSIQPCSEAPEGTTGESGADEAPEGSTEESGAGKNTVRASCFVDALAKLESHGPPISSSPIQRHVHLNGSVTTTSNWNTQAQLSDSQDP